MDQRDDAAPIVRREDLVLRVVAYAVMLAVVGLALGGVFKRDGDATAATSSAQARVEYPSVTRQGLKPSLVIEVTNRGSAARSPSVEISGAYLDGLQLEGLTPDPEDSTSLGDGLLSYGFAPLAPGARARLRLAFSIDEQASGLRFRTPLRVSLGREVVLATHLTTVVLP